MILGDDYADRVRNRIGVDEDDLPVEAIDEVLPVVEKRLSKYNPEDKTLLEAVAVDLVAAQVCPYLRTRIPTSERGPHGAFENAQDWMELQGWLEQNAQILLEEISEESGESVFVPHFVLGRRSR